MTYKAADCFAGVGYGRKNGAVFKRFHKTRLSFSRRTREIEQEQKRHPADDRDRSGEISRFSDSGKEDKIGSRTRHKQRIFAEAEKNIAASGYGDIIELYHGKAETKVAELLEIGEKFDLIFQDCGKYLYPMLLESTVKLCKKGGIIAADDSLFRVTETVRSGLGDYTHDYNRAVFAHKKLLSTILPIGHGLTISLKI